MYIIYKSEMEGGEVTGKRFWDSGLGIIGSAKGYNLGDLLKQITTDNLHEAVDFGRPQGKEVC